jgi:hypothetical protein
VLADFRLTSGDLDGALDAAARAHAKKLGCGG